MRGVTIQSREAQSIRMSRSPPPPLPAPPPLLAPTSHIRRVIQSRHLLAPLIRAGTCWPLSSEQAPAGLSHQSRHLLAPLIRACTCWPLSSEQAPAGPLIRAGTRWPLSSEQVPADTPHQSRCLLAPSGSAPTGPPMVSTWAAAQHEAWARTGAVVPRTGPAPGACPSPAGRSAGGNEVWAGPSPARSVVLYHGEARLNRIDGMPFWITGALDKSDRYGTKLSMLEPPVPLMAHFSVGANAP